MHKESSDDANGPNDVRRVVWATGTSFLISFRVFYIQMIISVIFRLVFEGPVLGPAKDQDWTGPGPERTAKLKDRKRLDRIKTAKDWC